VRNRQGEGKEKGEGEIRDLGNLRGGRAGLI